MYFMAGASVARPRWAPSTGTSEPPAESDMRRQGDSVRELADLDIVHDAPDLDRPVGPGPHLDHRADALADLERPLQRAAHHDRGRAGGLVLGDAHRRQ